MIITQPHALPTSDADLSTPRQHRKSSGSNTLAEMMRLLHNHPSGDPTPSRADIDMTRHIADVAKPLGIVVHDHIIVGRDGHASLKGLQLI